ncbi:MAG: alpha-glucan family phosphorylase [Cyanobacteria bacterium P01_H01_bin.153]
MRPIRTFNVTPALPARLEGLRKLAYNLQWDWDVDTVELFRRLDPDLWESSHYNPVLMLGMVSQQRLQAAADDAGFVAQADRAVQRMDDYLRERTWYHKNRPQSPPNECYAYFSMEFGLTSCMPVYSGGLGVLAGDHLKSASDLGLPLVGVGLLYQEGYFAQYFNADGWQQERYPVNDFYNMPLVLERDENGAEIRIAVDYPGRTVYARIWRVQVGTVPLYLLDTNIEPNNQYDQDICDRLYGGDIDMRIHQEIMLGIGGVRMLEALGLKPTAYHMNEGHSAFLALERIRMLMAYKGLSYPEALQVATSSQIFTTHTPVPAGIDLFGADKILYYLGHYARQFGLSDDEFLALGREATGDLSTPFSMAVLAIKTATFVNGVSKLHGAVSRDMFGGLWQDFPKSEVPITSITNGVHARSCVAKPTQELYDRYLGPNWSQAGAQDPLWERVKSIPDGELWRNHEICRSQLVKYARNRLHQSLLNRDASPQELAKAEEVLDPSVLTIGFARRFATYKRATLFLKDLERIRKIITGNGRKDRRVQFVVAGKAHPKDIPGKELIRSIIHFTRDEGLDSSIVFVPNYDIHTARAMVAGADVWLNNPRRPREASGTSGMKAAMNGLLNLSVLDGWWDEADYVKTGWAIGSGEVYDDPDYQDEVEANALYELIEKEVVPLFYDRDENNVPRGWVAKMKDSVYLNTPLFNTSRMVKEYARRAYFMASDRLQQLSAAQFEPARELSAWQTRLYERWYAINIEAIDIAAPTDLQVNQTFNVQAKIALGQLLPEDVAVELYQGTVQVDGEMHSGTSITMEYQGQDTTGKSLYRAEMQYSSSGLQGLSLRLLPKHRYLHSSLEPRLILWAQPESVKVSVGPAVPTVAPAQAAAIAP